jgi:serine/threonine protein kinase/dienelactone hydrolase
MMKCPKCHSENTDTSRFCSNCATRLTGDGELPDSLTKTLKTPVHALSKGALVAGKYRIVEEIGRGGMGVVYCAHDDSLARDVAIKVLPAEFASDAGRLRRFEQEAKAAGQLNHPNILVVYDVGSQSGSPYLVTELLEGKSLRQTLSGGSLPMRTAIDYGTQIARGLAMAHERGIVHRDLKPENLFITRRGLVKILDFGLAKLRSDKPHPEETLQASTGMMVTEAGAIIGTVPYMSPEQAQGEPVDARTDIFSFGAVLYEMVTGRRAFDGETQVSILSAVLTKTPPAAGTLLDGVPPELDRILKRCLEKDPERRYPSADELSKNLAACLDTLVHHRISLRTLIRNPRFVVPVALLAVAAIAGATWFGIRGARVRTARNQWVPELVRLADAGNYWPAFLLARKIEAVVPGDPIVEKLRPRFAGHLAREIRPAGAEVLAGPSTGGDADWVGLGEAGKPIPTPFGYSVFKVQAPGYETREFGQSISAFDRDLFTMGGVMVLERQGEAPEGMARIENPSNNPLFLLKWPGKIGSFYADEFEVTNREYKRFVDAGGYQKREYWTEPFERDGKDLTWDEAMPSFVDTTGRPGPAGWQVGTFESGMEEFPVTGVSWYEAAAYARFVGKRLPSIYHFAIASATAVGGDFLPSSNFSGKLAPVGSYRGSLNYWGLYDTAGNAREWCWNAVGGKRYALGGAADGPGYMYWNVDQNARSPFGRNATTGFRCIKPTGPDPVDARLDLPVAPNPPVDWSKVEGFSEDAWKTWQNQLSYAKGRLDEKTEWTDDTLPSWRIEKVTFTAAYPDERVIAYLYIPKNVPPPWQAVIYVHPGFGLMVSSSQDGHNTMDLNYWDYLVKDGRVVVYPIFKGIFERGGGPDNEGNWSWSSWGLVAKDIFRTIDYLETRKDIRADRLGLLAFSGGADGGIMASAVEQRLKAVVLQGGGLFGSLDGDSSTDRERLGLARHISVPVQLVNGISDNWGQDVLLGSMATPPDRKRRIQFDGDHTLAGFEKDFMKVNLEWFDRYLGPVR